MNNCDEARNYFCVNKNEKLFKVAKKKKTKIYIYIYFIDRESSGETAPHRVSHK